MEFHVTEFTGEPIASVLTLPRPQLITIITTMNESVFNDRQPESFINRRTAPLSRRQSARLAAAALGYDR
uniref:Uncharacterized protein n=1 Tax=Anguilla anguilla TaxID=7936 RepID=A0A0E9SKE7_ANGAN